MGLSRRFGTRGGRRGTVVARVGAPVAPEVPVFDLLPNYWFRADNVTLAGANVATIPNKVGTDALVMAGGVLAAPASDPLFAGAPSLNFSGTQYLEDNLAPSAWKFLHDGTGAEVWNVMAMTNSSNLTWAVMCTANNLSLPGYSLSSYPNLVVGNGSGRIIDAAPGAPIFAVNVPITLSTFYKENNPIEFGVERLNASITPGSTLSLIHI